MVFDLFILFIYWLIYLKPKNSDNYVYLALFIGDKVSS